MVSHKPKVKKPEKVKPVKAPQAPQFDLAQMQIQQRTDATGIYITITYQGVPVHVFVLSVVEYQMWQRMSHEQKILFVRSKTNTGVFANNQQIVNMVTRATINILDTIFTRAQAQAQRRKVL